MKKPFSITVEESLYTFAQEEAAKEGRTLSNYIEHLIRKDKETKQSNED
jgi:hypothetical protein